MGEQKGVYIQDSDDDDDDEEEEEEEDAQKTGTNPHFGELQVLLKE